MRRIACNYYSPAEVSIDEYENIIGKMELDLQKICSEAVDELDLYYYVWKLLREAKPYERCPGMYFLGFADPASMPSDARVLYFYRPTYLAAAIIIRAAKLCPEILDDKTELSWEFGKEFRQTIKDVFPGLLLGCTGRHFQGHGFDGLQGQIDTLSIFARADADEFLDKYPDLCIEFTELYRSSMKDIEHRLFIGNVKNEWGDDYTEEAMEVVTTTQRR